MRARISLLQSLPGSIDGKIEKHWIRVFRDGESFGKPRFVFEGLELALRVAIVVGNREGAVALGQPQVGEHQLPIEEWQGLGTGSAPSTLGSCRR
jgi:hypothetical protein